MIKEVFVEEFWYDIFVFYTLNKILIPIIISIVLVGGIAVFSVYLQQDKALIEFSRATNPNYHCLDKWDYLYQQKSTNLSHNFIEENQEKFTEFVNANCDHSFREWLPETHLSWSSFVVGENGRKENCKIYLSGESGFKESDVENLKLWECENLLKGR